MTSSDATTVPPQDLPVIGSTPVLVQGNVEDSHIKTVPTTTLPSTTRELNRTDTATASTNGPPSDTANSTKTTLACVPAKFGEVDKNVTDEPASDARTHVLNAARTETDADATNQAPSQAESLTKRAKTCVGEELSWRNTNGPPSDTANSTKTTLACVPAKFGKVDKNVTDEPASDARTHILNASQTETDADAMNQAPSKAESVTKAGKTRVGGELSRRNTNGIHAICSDANKGRPKAGRTCEPPPATDKARGENATGTKKATKAGVGKTRTGGAGRKTGQKKSEGGGEGRAQKGRKGGDVDGCGAGQGGAKRGAGRKRKPAAKRKKVGVDAGTQTGDDGLDGVRAGGGGEAVERGLVVCKGAVGGLKRAEGGLCGMQTLEERNVELSREVQLLRDGVLRRVLEGGIHDNGGGGVVSAAACAGVIRKWVDANLYETLRLTHGVHAVCAGSEGAMGKCADDCTLTQADGAACVELCVQGLRLMRRQMEMGEVNERNVGCVQRVFDCVHVKLLEKLCRRKDAGGCMQVLENVLRCVLREVRRWYAEIMEGVCIRMRWCEVVTRGVLRRLYEIVKEGWCEGGEIVMGCVVEVLGDVAKRLEGREMDGEMSVGEFCNCCEVSVCVVGAFEEAVLGMKVGVDVVYVIGRHNPVFLRQWLMVQAQEA